MGPVSLRPSPGAGWARKGRPERQRADYNRRARHPLRLRRLRRPRRPAPGQAAPEARRQRHARASCARSGSPIRPATDLLDPGQPVGQLGAAAIREFAAGNRIELVATPTYASYLNPVECHFSALITSSSSPTPITSTGTPSSYALAKHVRYRNGDHRDQRLAAAERSTPDRRLMTFRAQRKLSRATSVARLKLVDGWRGAGCRRRFWSR